MPVTDRCTTKECRIFIGNQPKYSTKHELIFGTFVFPGMAHLHFQGYMHSTDLTPTQADNILTRSVSDLVEIIKLVKQKKNSSRLILTHPGTGVKE